MRLLRLLDRLFLRTPFEQPQADRYARQRPALGDLDSRLVQTLDALLRQSRVLLDLGSGAGQLSRLLFATHPHLTVLTIDPSRAFAPRLRARAESLPLAPASVDLAICLSSLRHAQDRTVALGELRRVVRPGGTALIVELDPDSDAARRDRHARAMPLLPRLSFRFGLAIAPPMSVLTANAREAGWTEIRVEADPLQPLGMIWLG